jgi:hypothetical protein
VLRQGRLKLRPHAIVSRTVPRADGHVGPEQAQERREERAELTVGELAREQRALGERHEAARQQEAPRCVRSAV